MAYLIYKADGTPVTVPDGAIDVAFYNPTGGGGFGPLNVPQPGGGLGTQLVGRNATDYGAAWAQNFLQLTANFSSSTVPSDTYSLQGQLWFKQNSISDGNLYVKTDTTQSGIANWKELLLTSNTGDLSVSGSVTAPGGFIGNASTASALATSRSISTTGDATWTVNFNGSANATAALTLATVNSTVGTFGDASTVPVITVNGKGQITNVTTAIISGGGGTATNIAGGVAGSIPYQTAPSTTNFIAGGAVGYVLTSNGAAVAPTWQAVAGTGTVTSIDVSGGTTGLTTSGGPITGAGTITLAGTLAIANGGTGQTTATAAINALLPTQAANSGKYLTTDGTNTSWTTVTATNATNATNVAITDDTATAVAVYPMWTSATSGNVSPRISSTKITLVPSTGTITTTGDMFVGSTVRVGKGPGSGTKNTALGINSLAIISTGDSNTAIGNGTLALVTGGNNNTAVGDRALASNTANNNTAFGSSALTANTTGIDNTALGLFSMPVNTTGSYNTAVGSSSLRNNTTGQTNTSVGFLSLFQNTTGSQNTALGYSASESATTGSGNVAIGFAAMGINTTGGNNIAIGYNSIGYSSVVFDTIAIGTESAANNSSGVANIAIGHQSLKTNTVGGYNISIGQDALTSAIGVSGSTAIGYQALKAQSGSTGNDAIGYKALTNNTTGDQNLGIGNISLSSNTTGSYNLGIGKYSLFYNVTGNYNLAVGWQACLSNLGTGNVGVGYRALMNNVSGLQNTAIGTNSGNLTGDYNVAAGGASGSGSGSQNTSVGYGSLGTQFNGYSNTAVGFSAGSNMATGNNSTMIGSFALASSSSASNEITLGNNSITTLRCQVTSITALSDERDKKDIAPLSYGLDFISSLKPVSFTWNMRDGGKVGIKSSGFIAQDLKKAQEDVGATETLNLVYESNPEKLEATYGNLIPVLVKAIQDLKAEIDNLKEQLKGK